MSATDTDPLEARYRARSLWLDGIDDPLLPRPPLVGDADCDVAIVGAGFTGLWTAYALSEIAPELRVVVLEREIAGFGPSGRNGGWVSGGIAGNPQAYARTHGAAAVRVAERATYRAVDEIGRVAAAEGIDCGYVKGGALFAATSRAQVSRLRDWLERERAWGAAPDDVRILDEGELQRRVRVAGALAAGWFAHAARIDPARLVRGLAAAVERRGVTIHERSEALAIEPGVVTTATGALRAPRIVRATEAYTVELRGERRRYLPLYSLMVATEPLPPDVWRELGWEGGETVADLRHLFFYAQRTADGRIALGGRGAPYRLGSPIDEGNERNRAVYERLAGTIRRHFPAAADARITHHWGGPLAVPRDWCQAMGFDRATGIAWGGGYTGHGVVASHVTGRTLADLVCGRDSELTRLPWVGRRARRWEPEPLRFAASRAIVAVMGSADRAEEHLPATAARMRLIRPFLPSR